MNIPINNNVDHKYNEIIKCRFENVSSLPSGLGTSHKGYTVFNTSSGKLHYWNGSAWVDPSATGGGGASPTPGNVYFVSPTFTNSSPYFNTITGAMVLAGANDLVIVYPGTYQEYVTCHCDLYLHEGAEIQNPSGSAGSVLYVGGGASTNIQISGNGVISNNQPGSMTIRVDGSTEANICLKAVYDAVTPDYSIFLSSNKQIDFECDDINAAITSDADRLNLRAKRINAPMTISRYAIINCDEFLSLVAQGVGEVIMTFSRNINPALPSEIVRVGDNACAEFQGGTIDHRGNDSVAAVMVAGDGAKCRLKHVRIIKKKHCCCYIDRGTLIADNCTLITEKGMPSIGGSSGNSIALKNWGSVAVEAPSPVFSFWTNYFVQQVLVDVNVE